MRRLLVVEKAFDIRGRGLVLTPALAVLEGSTSTWTRARVELRRPDGSVGRADATLGLERLDSGAFEMVCILPGTPGDEVPPGTEVWLVPSSA